MTTSGDPHEPRPGQDERPPEPGPYESGPTGGDETPPAWSAGGPPGAGPTGGTMPEGERPVSPGGKPPSREDEPPSREDEPPSREDEPPSREEEPPSREEEEPIAPAPPVVPPLDVPPTHEPRPGVEPKHPDLPTSPEIPPPAEGDAEATQAYPVPGGTPPYPGWEGAPPEGEPPGRPTPSRYEQGQEPSFTPSGAQGPPPGATPPVTPYGTYAQEPPVVPGTTPSSPYGGPPGYGAPPPYPYPPYQQLQEDKTGSGLATASLVLGVASPFLVFVCFTGLITAILSIVFGCVALAKRAGKGRAIAGIVISVLSLVLFTIVALWFWNVVEDCAHLSGPEAERCFQERFPWMSGGR
ncbi:hypothetical protein [Nonomuraea sp. NPDC049480]|uniref:hypothetical protein n=1 Tax=Nonomuraea sp. NPDC049480 TaxID=3364353 RepID=UPI00379C86D4